MTNDRHLFNSDIGIKLLDFNCSIFLFMNWLCFYQVTIELFKLLRKAPLEDFKNSFLSLALPVIVLSEPGPAKKTKIG